MTIHLATAASIAAGLGAVLSYDHRLIAEGLTLGLPVLTPAWNDRARSVRLLRERRVAR